MSTSTHTQLPDWADYPYPIKGTTGGFLRTNLIICGGLGPKLEVSDECHNINQKTTKTLTKMQSKRYEAASVIIREKYLWVSGGNDGFGTLSSTELIEIGTTAGPKMPTALEGHEMININDSFTLLVGGSSAGEEQSASFYFDHTKTHPEENQWSDGPRMEKGRKHFAVGVVTDKTTLKKFVVVTGGLGVDGALTSTEFLLKDIWLEGEITHH